MLPTVVHRAAAAVTSLLFASGTDCVLVGDTEGEVTVYQLKNLGVGRDKQVHLKLTGLHVAYADHMSLFINLLFVRMTFAVH